MKRFLFKEYQHRMLCTLLLLCAGVTSALANTQTFYYAANAYASPTGGGKVYVSSTSTADPQYQQSPHGITGSQRTIGYGDVTLYYYAQANDGYIFDHWAEESVSGTSASTRSSFNVSKEFRSTSSSSPTTFNYFAVFKAQTGQIKVKSADENKGGVSISNPDNEMGDEVTLTANPDVSNGVMFLGWKKDNTGEYISTDNPLVLTASSETKGTYWAYFSDAADKVYIRLKNKKTGRFLSFYGDTKATDHTRDYDNYKNVKDGFKFDGSLKMISAADAQGNPSTVFLRSGHPQGTGVTTGADFSAHSIAYSTLVGANLSSNKYMLTMEGDGSSVRIYTTYTLSVSGRELNLPTYLSDEGGDYAVMKTIQGLSADEQSAAEWILYSLDETTTTGAFGANTKAKYTRDGKYYTTMYTDFPYKLLDGVNAYYLVFNADFTEITDRAVFTQVEGDIVPANMAVILECSAVQNDITSTDVVTNRLLPLVGNYESIVNPGANFLKGYVSVNGSTVANNKERMYVLSTFDGKLGFYHYNKTNMTPNKAYLLAPEVTKEERESYESKVSFYFGDPDDVASEQQTPSGIILSEQIADEDDKTPVYDLNGRKVAEGKVAENMLRPGVYVKKGKKIVVK